MSFELARIWYDIMMWLLLIALVAAEAAGFWRWLHREYYPVIFNGWAITIYTFIFTADAVFVWQLARFVEPAAYSGLETIAVLSIMAAVIVLLFTLFLRWVIRQDLPEPPE